MCGILALLAPYTIKQVRESRLKMLAGFMRHRGPDYQGEWWDHDTGLGLAHRRLSILDLSRDGHQPMVSASGRYVISFNGEIYNFLALREELEDARVKFHSRSDTEVILAAIEKYGLNQTCQKLNGMFAIILWDKDRQELHLIRDRFGKKPLYVGWVGKDLMVASELKPYIKHPDFNKKISQEAVAHYLHLGCIPAPYSIFEKVWMLMPGCRILIAPKKLDLGADLRPLMDPYWQAARAVEESFLRRGGMAQLPVAERIMETEKLLDQCVRDRMVADVSLGAFLSGGIDSSTVVALMQKHATERVKTYSIGFTEEAYNEASHARLIADHLGTDHYEQILTPDDAMAIIPELPKICDEPMADVSLIPTYLVSKFARGHVTVALSGDGGDEMFGGYNRHIFVPKIFQRTGWVPAPLRGMLAKLMGRVPPAMIGQDQEKIRKLLAILPHAKLDDVYELLVGGAEDNVITRQNRVLSGYPFRLSSWWPTPLSVAEWVMMADILHYLPNDILIKVDRASMAVGLEARAPLLDMRLFSHVWSLPEQDRIHDGQGKWILRQILKRHVPESYFDRPKQGFAVPIDSWLLGPMYDMTQQHLQDKTLTDHFGLDGKVILDFWQAYQSGQQQAPMTIWRLLILKLWADFWLKS